MKSGDSELAAPVVAMLAALGLPALRELERAFTPLLRRGEPTPTHRRTEELGHLAELVRAELAERRPGDRRPPRVPRKAYDRDRPPGAPSSRALVRRHGSWLAACRAAAALDAGERPASPGKPWATPSLGRRRNPDYTREDVVEAVIEVAKRLDRDPSHLTSTAYYSYVAEMRRILARRGTPPPRWPTQRSVERHFKSWNAVRKAVRRLKRELARSARRGQGGSGDRGDR